MKKNVSNLLLITVIVFSITVVGTGCGLIKGLAKVKSSASKSVVKTAVIKSADGKESINIPESWKEDNGLNSVALLQVSESAKEKYAMVIGEEKDSSTKDIKLSDYTDASKAQMIKSATTATATDSKDVTINGNKAQYFEVTAEVTGVKVTYFVQTMESADKFYQVVGWTSTSKVDANKTEIRDVMDSFKVLK